MLKKSVAPTLNRPGSLQPVMSWQILDSVCPAMTGMARARFQAVCMKTTQVGNKNPCPYLHCAIIDSRGGYIFYALNDSEGIVLSVSRETSTRL